MTNEQILDRMCQIIRVGFVNARQPEKMRVKVTLPDTVTAPLVTDWLPVLCPRASQDMQYDLPDVGDQVLCLFLPYGLEQGFVIGSMYGRQVPPVQSGDKWHRTFNDGTYLEYDRAAHKLKAQVKGDIEAAANASVLIKAEKSMTLEAPIIYARGKFINTDKDGSPGKSVFSGGMEVLNGGLNVPDADVVASDVSLVSHTHTGVQPGNGTSSVPVGGGPSPGTGTQGGSGAASDNYEKHLEALRDEVRERGSDTDKLIMCLPDIAEAMAEKETDLAIKDAWLYLREMFIRWLSGVANENTLSLNEPFWIDWDWAMKSLRAQAGYNEFISPTLQEGTIYSHAAMKSLGKILCKNGYLDPSHQTINFDFTNSDWQTWDKLYFTHYKMPYPLNMDGVYVALGSFTFRALAGGNVENLGNGKWRLTLKKVSIFIHDSFNFAPDIHEYTIGLGWWSCEKKDGAEFFPYQSYLRLDNEKFRKFRNLYGKGEDFLVFSKPNAVENVKEASYEFSCENL